MEHEIAHGNDLSHCNDSLGGEDFAEKAAEHALKQNALNRRLLDLNKVLVQKEELAKAMASSDEKFQASAHNFIWLHEVFPHFVFPQSVLFRVFFSDTLHSLHLQY